MNALAKSLYTVYTEERTPLHDQITDNQFRAFASYGFSPRVVCSILDVGCGTGVAWPVMRACYGDPVIKAITPNPVEAQYCRDNGVYWVGSVVSEADVNPKSIDLVWCRHTLEHSITPFGDLLAFFDVLTDDGGLYVEVPSPDTDCGHEFNPNHYSVMGDKMWKSLFDKAGFSVFDSGVIEFALEIGKDQYFWYILGKK